MLKQLLQLLLETFLKAKKEWIQTSNGANTKTGPTRYQEAFIAPSNGVVTFVPKRSSSGMAGCFFQVNGKTMFELSPALEKWTSAATLRVNKGDNISYGVGAGTFESVEFRFYPLV